MADVLSLIAVGFLALNVIACLACIFLAGFVWAWTNCGESADIFFRLTFFFVFSTVAAGIMAIPAIKHLGMPL